MKNPSKPLIAILKLKYPEISEKELYSMVLCGEVSVNGETVREHRRLFRFDSEINLKMKKWVSRAGEKLDFALTKWNINTEGKTVLDAGSSTGGFTDCLLQHGASLVYAIDVGYNQLAYTLRQDKRVVVMEKTNIMSVENLSPAAHFAVADLSFRSISGAAGHILSNTLDDLLIALIKPQFEYKGGPDFNGIITDRKILKKIILETAEALTAEEVYVSAMLESPVRGTKGNTEFLFRTGKKKPESRSAYDSSLSHMIDTLFK